MEWLNGSQLACGGGEQNVLVYDVSTSQRLFQLAGHTESVKAITSLADNPYVCASGSRDGSLFIFDLRCNRVQISSDSTTSGIRSQHSLSKAHFIETAAVNSHRGVLKAKSTNNQTHHVNLKPSPVACLAFQDEFFLVSAGGTDGFIKVSFKGR